MIYTAEKSLKDNEGKISDEIKAGVNEKVTALKAVKDGTDKEAIMKATTELSTEMQKIGEYMAKNAPQSAPNAGNDSTTEGPVRDANFEEKKDGEAPKA